MAGDWLSDLARSRQAPSHGAQPRTVLERDEDPQGRARWTLTMPAPEESSSVVAEVLLAAFVESTTPGARAAEQQGLLPRGIEITTPGIPPPAGAPVEGGQLATAAAHTMQVRFTATDPAAEGLVEEAARLFEAYWQYHIKAAKSDLHCRMRSRLSALQQQLMLTKFDGL